MWEKNGRLSEVQTNDNTRTNVLGGQVWLNLLLNVDQVNRYFLSMEK